PDEDNPTMRMPYVRTSRKKDSNKIPPRLDPSGPNPPSNRYRDVIWPFQAGICTRTHPYTRVRLVLEASVPIHTIDDQTRHLGIAQGENTGRILHALVKRANP